MLTKQYSGAINNAPAWNTAYQTSGVQNLLNNSINANQNATQLRILDEFLKYAKMAEYNFKFTQATNYDTTNYRSAETLTRKVGKTIDAEQTNIISSVKNILTSTFIGHQANIIGQSISAMGAVLKLDQLEFRSITNKVLKSFSDDQYLSADNYEKIAVQIKAAFIDYAIQTKTNLNERIKELLVNPDTCVALKLEKAKMEYPDMDILKELTIESGIRADGAKSIKLRAKPDLAIDDNMYTGMMRELRDNPGTNQLYKDIVDLSILQGTYSSAISIRSIIPIEDYSKIVTPIIFGLKADQSFTAFEQGSFQKNNFRNSDVVPFVDSVKFKENYNKMSYNEYGEPTFGYDSSLFNMFNVEGLGIKSDDKRLLFLDERYNYMNIGDEFVKIPRVVVINKTTNESIDMITGKEITSRDYAIMKEKGDQSLKDVFGYQRVRHDVTGEPLIHAKQIYNKFINFHVYKLVNLLGDGDRATENYEFNKPSVIDNGSVKIENEIPNADIFEHFGAKLIKEDVSLPAIEAPVSEKEYTSFEEVSDVEPRFKLMGNEVIYSEDGSTAEEYNSPEEAKEGLAEWMALDKPVAKETKSRELFTFEKAIAQKSFRNKTLAFVDNISTKKDTVVGMSNNKKTKVISIDQKAMIQKFEDKAWTNPSKQLDGSFATPLAENEFKSPEEFFTFALLHETKHDSIFKQENETTGEYEDRINQAALSDLRKNYNTQESIANVMTELGTSIALLGISQEEWNSLSKEEQEQIKKCN